MLPELGAVARAPTGGNQDPNRPTVGEERLAPNRGRPDRVLRGVRIATVLAMTTAASVHAVLAEADRPVSTAHPAMADVRLARQLGDRLAVPESTEILTGQAVGPDTAIVRGIQPAQIHDREAVVAGTKRITS
jgi:hypothetical protein